MIEGDLQQTVKDGVSEQYRFRKSLRNRKTFTRSLAQLLSRWEGEKYIQSGSLQVDLVARILSCLWTVSGLSLLGQEAAADDGD